MNMCRLHRFLADLATVTLILTATVSFAAPLPRSFDKDRERLVDEDIVGAVRTVLGR